MVICLLILGENKGEVFVNLKKLRPTTTQNATQAQKNGRYTCTHTPTSIISARYDLVILILLEGCGWRPAVSDILWDASGR